MATAPLPASPAPPKRHALGLPAGSIRAMLALGVLVYIWIVILDATVRGDDVLGKNESLAFIYLQFLMVLILAHFFTAHNTAVSGQSPRPLGLPGGSVRLILLLGYLGMGVYMYHHQLGFTLPDTAPILLLLLVLTTAYFAGYLITSLVAWMYRGQLPPWFLDVQAWFALLAMILLGIEVIIRMVINTSLPYDKQLTLEYTEAILAGLVGFYFGARS